MVRIKFKSIFLQRESEKQFLRAQFIFENPKWYVDMLNNYLVLRTTNYLDLPMGRIWFDICSVRLDEINRQSVSYKEWHSSKSTVVLWKEKHLALIKIIICFFSFTRCFYFFNVDVAYFLLLTKRIIYLYIYFQRKPEQLAP